MILFFVAPAAAGESQAGRPCHRFILMAALLSCPAKSVNFE